MHLHLVTLHVKLSPQSVPLAAAFLQASISANFQHQSAVRVTTSDHLCGTPVETMAARIAEIQADIIGFSLYVWNRCEITALTHQLRDLFPQIILLGGGPEATADPQGLMKEALFDFLVVGEGEGTLAELLHRQIKGLPLDNLPGIVRRQEGEMTPSPPPPPPPLSLEKLPSPWLSGLLDAYIPQGVLWQLARGCSFGCDFCFDGMGTRTVRRFPLARIKAELEYLVRHGVHQIFVLDSTFNQDLKRAKLILKMIREKAPQVHFHFEIRYEFLDAESAQLFAAIPCSLQIGLQSSSPHILGQVGRRFDPHEFSRKIALLNHCGVTFGFDLIYGLPGDSLLEFKKSLDFALRQYPNQLDIFPLAILPGTPLAAKAEALQLSHLPHPPYTILSSPTFSVKELVTARHLAGACDIFYSRGKAVAWFNSVTVALKLSPSSLLFTFSEWISASLGNAPDPAAYDDKKIWSLQCDFLRDLFTRQQAEHLLPMLLDLIDYHYYHAAVVQSPPPRSRSKKELAKVDVLHTPLRQSVSSYLAIFHYNIEELLDLGEPQLVNAVSRLKPVGSFAVLYSCQGEVFTEILPKEYFQLLERLDGHYSAVKIAESLGISGDAAKIFLDIALREGIIVTSGK